MKYQRHGPTLGGFVNQQSGSRPIQLRRKVRSGRITPIVIISRLCRWLGYLLFALMLIVPTQLVVVKSALMGALLAAIIVTSVVRRKWNVHPLVMKWTVFTVLVGCGFVVLGWQRGTPGALSVITVYLLWPIVFTMLVAGIGSDMDFIHGLIRTMLISSLVIALVVLDVIRLEPDSWLLGATISGIEPDFNYFRVPRYAIGTLVFTVPFTLTVVLTWTNEWKKVAGWPWLFAAAMLGLVAGIGLDRRALWVAIVIAPIIGTLLPYILSVTMKVKIHMLFGRIAMLGTGGLIIGLLLSWTIPDYSIAALTMWLNNTLTGGEIDYSDLVRQQQYNTLLSAWLEQPIFGTGFGAVVPGPLRSSAMPWASELSYLLLLYHTGLAGFLAYSASVVWVFVTGIRIIRSGRGPSSLMSPMLTGFACFLIANATNPYLSKYDHMWTLFLPLACINYWLIMGTMQTERSGDMEPARSEPPLSVVAASKMPVYSS